MRQATRKSGDVSTATISLSNKLFLAAVATSPFQTAFTLDVGFPLKPSEVFIVLGLLAYPFSRLPASRSGRGESICIGILAALISVSTLYRLLVPEPAGPHAGYARSLMVDIVLYLGYSVLVLFLWSVASRVESRHLRSAVVVAVWLCAGATALQFILTQAGFDAILSSLNYQTDRLGTAFGAGITRTGPFVEGQHLGFFGGAAFFMALRSRRFITAFVAAALVVYSQSTTAFLAIFIAVSVTAVLQGNIGRAVKTFAWFGIAGTASLAIPQVREFVKYQLGKTGLSPFGGQVGIDRSADIRSAKNGVAWDMTTDNPFLGVGPGRFGVWFDDFANHREFPSSFFNGLSRPIAENGYLQLSAEVGIPALAAFVIFLLLVARKAFKSGASDFSLAMFTIISISTLSSWTFIPLWVTLAYLSSIRCDATASGTEPGQRSAIGRVSPIRSVLSPPTSHRGF